VSIVEKFIAGLCLEAIPSSNPLLQSSPVSHYKAHYVNTWPWQIRTAEKRHI